MYQLNIHADGINTRINRLRLEGVTKSGEVGLISSCFRSLTSDSRATQTLKGRAVVDDVTSSTNKHRLDELFKDGTSGYWESDGPQAAHWLRIKVCVFLW